MAQPLQHQRPVSRELIEQARADEFYTVSPIGPFSITCDEAPPVLAMSDVALWHSSDRTIRRGERLHYLPSRRVAYARRVEAWWNECESMFEDRDSRFAAMREIDRKILMACADLVFRNPAGSRPDVEAKMLAIWNAAGEIV